MYLMLAEQEELVRDVKTGSFVGCNGHKVVEFRIVRGENEANIRIRNPWFQERTDLGLVRDLLGRIPWKTVLGSTGSRRAGYFSQEAPP